MVLPPRYGRWSGYIGREWVSHIEEIVEEAVRDEFE